jgi:putative transposon-encoded protein
MKKNPRIMKEQLDVQFKKLVTELGKEYTALSSEYFV